MDVQMGSVKDVPALIKYHAINADGTVSHIHADGQLHALTLSEACRVSEIRHVYKLLECQFHILHVICNFCAVSTSELHFH
jgi:hypothetical protein